MAVCGNCNAQDGERNAARNSLGPGSTSLRGFRLSGGWVARPCRQAGNVEWSQAGPSASPELLSFQACRFRKMQGQPACRSGRAKAREKQCRRRRVGNRKGRLTHAPHTGRARGRPSLDGDDLPPVCCGLASRAENFLPLLFHFSAHCEWRRDNVPPGRLKS